MTGQLGRKLDAKDGIEQLTLLSDSGNARATISLAEALYWGHGVAADSVRAIEVLRRGAKLGLRPVTSKLISLYRDAPGGKIKRSLKEARATLDANKQQFSKEEYVREEILLEAAAARNISGYSKVKEKLSSLSSASRLETLIALRSANPNVFVYVVQFELKKRGLFRGDSNGLLRASTITAMNKLCSKSVSGERCRLGPFSYEAARVISIMLESGLAPTAALE